jgi:hypothetical protein
MSSRELDTKIEEMLKDLTNENKDQEFPDKV